MCPFGSSDFGKSEGRPSPLSAMGASPGLTTSSGSSFHGNGSGNTGTTQFIMLNISPCRKINCGRVRFGAPSRWLWRGSRHVTGPAREGGQVALISNVFRFFQSENTAKFWQFPKASRDWLDHVITGVYVGQQQPAHEIPRAPQGPAIGCKSKRGRMGTQGPWPPTCPPHLHLSVLFLCCSEMDFSWKMLSGTRKSLKPCIFSNIPIFQMKKMRSIERK